MGKVAYYLIVFPFSFLPLPFLYGFTSILYVLLTTVFPYRKKVITDNLSRSFPDKTEKEISQLRQKFYRHFCDLLAEGIKNLSISEKELRKRLVVKNPEVMNELYEEGKSAILVSGHYNNWEWLISAQNFLFPHQAYGIGMPMTSKFWDKKINERRSRFGMRVIHSKNFKQEIEKSGDDPIAILTLGDQSPGDSNKSFWMEFLNQTTAVQFGTEMMAHSYNFSVVFFVMRKMKRGYYEMELKLITKEPKTCKWGEITREHTLLLEQEIIQVPEYWIWSHKRWKREVPENLNELKINQEKKFNEKFSRH